MIDRALLKRANDVLERLFAIGGWLRLWHEERLRHSHGYRTPRHV